ncbi:hypothetical protein CTAYLR_001951 [Chrysophaeum taylorii]|uniref:Uncharacterized protein n=1 Tax=Chrysophaeum taylorii TaxID=2483200 RepID=A0AAD7XJ81_9STRA|nr:hypothetical protein CTAYLR_001951 [Chrysophaeum taylorii]
MVHMSDEVPVVDIAEFVKTGASPACAEVAEALHKYGCLVVRDPRVEPAHNELFLDMMERYFSQSDGVTDARPELHYQVGVTPSGVEKARNHCGLAHKLKSEGYGPLSECPPHPDSKWRFFWRIGPRPAKTAFADLNAAPVVPAGFEEEWGRTMDAWGDALVETAETVARMAALGFGMKQETAISDLMDLGPHLLAPTGSDLSDLDGRDESKPKRGAVLAAFHYDLNLLTVHGKSRFPGLAIWRRDGVKCAPKIPEGCLLVQAGKQLEWLTGGHVLAGFHEVIANDAAARAAEKARADAKPTWRVSSTCFSHVAYDRDLSPLPPFDTPDATMRFPTTKAGTQVMDELNAIKLVVS